MDEAPSARLIAFPTSSAQCRVWCPYCSAWHYHGYDGIEVKRWSHRVAHCFSETPFSGRGYWIKLADPGDMAAAPASAEAFELPKTLSVPEAGARYFGLSRNASYEAACRGDLPVIKIGRLLRVSVPALERMLAEVPAPPREPD